MKPADQILLEDHLKTLRLPVMRQVYPECTRQAKSSGAGYEEFLLILTDKEVEQRRNNQLKKRLREAGFPQLKTLESTDIQQWPGLNAAMMREYADCEYIQRRENVIFIGKHGTGKSHAAIAFGVEACRKGFSVFFTTAANLVNTLTEARDQKTLTNLLRKLKKVQLLIVDELGYIPFSETGAQLLFQVISDRYEAGSVMVTSNRPFAEWTAIFKDPHLTASLLDRLTHHGDVHQFNWESIRFAESLKRQKRSATQKVRSSPK